MQRLTLWLLHALAMLPLWALHALGAGIGHLAASLPNDLRRVTRRNLELCLPELDVRSRRRLARRSLVETGKAVTESSALLLWRPERVVRRVRDVEGESLLREAVEGGSGAIVCVPHLGAWEVMNIYCSMRYPVTSMYRPQNRQPMLDETLRRGRERAGAHLVPSDARGVRALFRALGKGHLLGVLPDQNPGRGEGVFVPFFGIQANTMVLVPRLARRTGAPVILGYAQRLPRGRGYRLHLERADTEVASEDTAAAAAALNRALERLIRRQPEQYWWSYKRFRKRPSGQPPIY